MTVDPPAPSAPSTEDLATYRAVQAQAGRDAEAHVRLALWCEAHGLRAERLKHLAIAVLINPRHAAARGLMGLVVDGGQWLRPEAVAERVQADTERVAQRAEYNARRARAQDTAASQWDLALWCEQQGLTAEATAHFTAVVRLDPRREAAWKRLGCKKHNGRWMTAEQIAAETAEAEAQQKADRHWRPLLETWRVWLGESDRQAEAEDALVGVTDPRAVPSIGKVFGRGREADQLRATQLLGQIDDPAASRGLTALAVFGPTAEVRRAATETLKRRDPREYADLLIGLLRDPIKYEVRPVGGPGAPGTLFIEGKAFNVQRLYAPPAPPQVPLQPGDVVSYDADGLPVVNRPAGYTQTGFLHFVTPPPDSGDQVGTYLAQNGLGETGKRIGPLLAETQNRTSLSDEQAAITASLAARSGNASTQFNLIYQQYAAIPVGRMAVEAQASAQVARRQLQNDIDAIEAQNAPIRRRNERSSQILRDITGLDLGADREAWKGWWIDQLGYSYHPETARPRPTLVQNVPLAYQPIVPVRTFLGPLVDFQRISCFGAGTPVRTLDGIRPIETIRVGDQVLTQDTATGALSFQPVLAVHHNPPSRTLRVQIGDEAIVSSTFHRFWRAGQGWAMARDLKPGDTLRTFGGLAQVVAVEAGGVQPVFNLDVAANRTFFVGQAGTVVHDNSLPILRSQPFDAGPSLAALAPPAD